MPALLAAIALQNKTVVYDIVVSVAVSTRRIVIDEGARIQISAADGAGV
jgi:hypothetical protein